MKRKEKEYKHYIDILKVEFMKPRRLQLDELSEDLQVPLSELFELVEYKSPLTDKYAILFGEYFGTGANFWRHAARHHEHGSK